MEVNMDYEPKGTCKPKENIDMLTSEIRATLKDVLGDVELVRAFILGQRVEQDCLDRVCVKSLCSRQKELLETACQILRALTEIRISLIG